MTPAYRGASDQKRTGAQSVSFGGLLGLFVADEAILFWNSGYIERSRLEIWLQGVF